MSFPKWFIVFAVSGSLIFTAVKSPNDFSSIASIGLPLLTQILDNQQNKQVEQNKDKFK